MTWSVIQGHGTRETAHGSSLTSETGTGNSLSTFWSSNIELKESTHLTEISAQSRTCGSGSGIALAPAPEVSLEGTTAWNASQREFKKFLQPPRKPMGKNIASGEMFPLSEPQSSHSVRLLGPCDATHPAQDCLLQFCLLRVLKLTRRQRPVTGRAFSDEPGALGSLGPWRLLA